MDEVGAGVVVVVEPRRLRMVRRVGALDGASVVVVVVVVVVLVVVVAASVISSSAGEVSSSSSAELAEFRREDIWTARTVVGSGLFGSSIVASVVDRALTIDVY